MPAGDPKRQARLVSPHAPRQNHARDILHHKESVSSESLDFLPWQASLFEVIISQTEKQLCETIHKIIGIFDSLMRFESATEEGARREPSILIHDLGVALRRGRWRHKVGIRRCACPDQGRRAQFV